jgi:hypothetical protein
MTSQAAQFRRTVIDNKPRTGGLNWRTIIQYATELGGVRSDGDNGDRFAFPDGSYAHVTGLHSGNPRVDLR